MDHALAASLVDLLPGLQLGAAGQDAGNRISLDGLVLAPKPEGALEAGIRRLEATSLRLASGPFALELGRLALHQVVGQLRVAHGKLRLDSLLAAQAELSGVKVQGPVSVTAAVKTGSHATHVHGGTSTAGEGTAGQPVTGGWSLGPLAAADGTLRAEIVDAHLLFDADVTVPIRQGQVDFNQATVEHVGPDSRMGVSRLGLYVDAPNGRSYLYQFTAAPVAGVVFERRGALPGPWSTDRGSLRLQEFGEGLLRQGGIAHGLGFTEQARLLFARTALRGELQLGDGPLAAPTARAELAGRAEGRNAIRVQSGAVGRGLTAELASLLVRKAALQWRNLQLGFDEGSGPVQLELSVEAGQLRFALGLADLRLSGLRLQRRS